MKFTKKAYKSSVWKVRKSMFVGMILHFEDFIPPVIAGFLKKYLQCPCIPFVTKDDDCETFERFYESERESPRSLVVG